VGAAAAAALMASPAAALPAAERQALALDAYVAPVIVVWLVGAVGMALVSLVMLRGRNASLGDFGRAVLVGFAALVYAAMADGAYPHRLLVAGLGLLYSVRLGWHLWQDRVALRCEEDGRYLFIRGMMGDRAHLWFAVHFQVQVFVTTLLTLPLLIAANSLEPELSGWALLGVVVAQGALWLEGVADQQLSRFRADPENARKVCREGMWAWSRHPNYFFQWLVWCGFALVGLGAPGGLLGVVAPVAVYFLLTRVSGVPYVEDQALRSRGEEYRVYQAEVPVFFPSVPRPAAESEEEAAPRPRFSGRT
jgi:steroid 5-alpha reductase family enzyme